MYLACRSTSMPFTDRYDEDLFLIHLFHIYKPVLNVAVLSYSCVQNGSQVAYFLPSTVPSAGSSGGASGGPSGGAPRPAEAFLARFAPLTLVVD